MNLNSLLRDRGLYDQEINQNDTLARPIAPSAGHGGDVASAAADSRPT